MEKPTPAENDRANGPAAPSPLDGNLRAEVVQRELVEQLVRTQRDLALSLGAATNVEEVARISLDATLSISGIQSGGLYLVDEKGAVRLAAHRGLPNDCIAQVTCYPPESPHAQLAAAGKNLYYPYPGSPEVLAEACQLAGLSALAILPISHAGAVIGCYNIASSEILEFPAPVRLAMESIAAQIGASIARVQTQSELRDREQQFRRAERLASVGTLATGIAHEINNPLHGILMYAEAALLSVDRPDGMQKCKELLGKIQAETRRCGRIVASVLQFARREQSQKWPAELAEMLEHACDLTSPLAQSRKVDVRLAIPPRLPCVEANPVELEQVFVNLLSNAVEASEPGECVCVHVAADGETVRVEVIDRGSGIRAEDLPRVFDPFFTTRKHCGGTGLGLSIAHRIVEDHGGRVHVRNNPDKGTTMVVELPRATSGGGPSDD